MFTRSVGISRDYPSIQIRVFLLQELRKREQRRQVHRCNNNLRPIKTYFSLLKRSLFFIDPRDYRIELRGGDGVSYGNVYAINRLGTFGPVCDDEFGSNEANTVCR